MIFQLPFCGKTYNLEVKKEEYNNGGLAVVLIDTDDQEEFTVASSFIEDANLKKGEFCLKNWSENEDIANELIKQGIVIPTGRTVPSGWINAPVCTLKDGI